MSYTYGDGTQRCNYSMTPDSLQDLEYLLEQGFSNKSEVIRAGLAELAAIYRKKQNESHPMLERDST